MSRHVYWLPSDTGPTRAPNLFVIWIAILAIVFVVWTGVSVEPRLAPLAYGALVVAFVGLILFAVRRANNPPVVRELQAMELARLREHMADAISKGRALLRQPLSRDQRARVLTLLGTCAEHEGDFADAAEIFVRAEGVLRTGTMHPMVREQHLALVAAHRAFAHAASGDLQRATAALATTRLRDGFPNASALACRAELVIAARSGATDQLTQLLGRGATLLRNTLAWRDRALVHVLERIAAGGPTKRQLELEPALRAWVVAVIGANAEPYVKSAT